jgi:hypothetical protein
VEHAVEWGLAHRDLSDVTALGVDEIAWARGCQRALKTSHRWAH